MTPTLPSSTEFLLPPGLGDLHQKTLTWESNIELWKRELTFFQKLINEYGVQLQLREHIREREHFKMLLNYYKEQLMNSFTAKMITHEEKLKSLMSDGKTQDESKYRNEHSELERQINTFEKELRCFKHELYLLIEKVLLKNKLKNHDISNVDH